VGGPCAARCVGFTAQRTLDRSEDQHSVHPLPIQGAILQGVDDLVARLASYYSEQAEVWEQRLAGLLHPLGLKLLERLPTDGVGVVLDLGTGSGTLLPTIAARAPQALVVAIDRAEGMVRLADSSFARAVADAARLPLADASVDTAVLAFMLFHLPQPDAGLQEVYRTLRPGGTVAVGTWTDANPPANQVWAQILDSHGARPDDIPARTDLMDTPEKVDGLLRRAGFETIATAIELEPDVMDLEEYLWRRTMLGSSGRRFRSLPNEAQAACLAAARERLAGLDP
jgi:SAM-dependent methyltransferase